MLATSTRGDIIKTTRYLRECGVKDRVKANDITKLPSPKKLEAEYAQLASEKAKFYEQYKEAKNEFLIWPAVAWLATVLTQP